MSTPPHETVQTISSVRRLSHNTAYRGKRGLSGRQPLSTWSGHADGMTRTPWPIGGVIWERSAIAFHSDVRRGSHRAGIPARFHHRMSHRSVPSRVIEGVAPTTQVWSCCAYLHGLIRPLCRRAIRMGWARCYRTVSTDDTILHLRQHVLFPRRVIAHAVMVVISRSC